jgi:hypothetical protein
MNVLTGNNLKLLTEIHQGPWGLLPVILVLHFSSWNTTVGL